jgi:hypothetical protein
MRERPYFGPPLSWWRLTSAPSFALMWNKSRTPLARNAHTAHPRVSFPRGTRARDLLFTSLDLGFTPSPGEPLRSIYCIYAGPTLRVDLCKILLETSSVRCQPTFNISECASQSFGILIDFKNINFINPLFKYIVWLNSR